MRLVMAGVAGFGGMTGLVGSGLSDAFDEAVLATLLPYRSQPAIDAVQLVTLLGSPILSSVLALGLTVRLVATDGRRGLVPLLFFAGFAVELALKAVIFQPGPPSELVYDAPLFVSLRAVTPFTYPYAPAMRIAFLASLVAWRVPPAPVPLAVVVALIAFGRVFLA